MSPRRALLAVAVAAMGCQDPPAATGRGEARAVRLTEGHRLPTGEDVWGAPGDFELSNGLIRVIISAADAPRGLSPYGGLILDADRVRPSGERSASSIGQIIEVAGRAAPRAERVEILSAGGGEAAAVVRVHATDGPAPLLAVYLGADAAHAPVGARWTIDYRLRPGAEWLDVEHQIELPPGTPLGPARFMFALGAAGQRFVPGAGFTEAIEDPVPGYTFVAEGLTWIYGRPEREMAPGEDANVGRAFLAELGEAAEGGAVTLRRALVVAPDLSEAQGLWRHLEGRARGTVLEGRVLDEAGRPVPGAHVHHLAAPDCNPPCHVSRTRADANGRFRLRVEAEKGVLRAARGGVLGPAVPARAGAELNLPSLAHLAVTVVDDAGRPLPAKLNLIRSQPAGGAPPASFGEVEPQHGLHHTAYAVPGPDGGASRAGLSLPSGAYRVMVSRGNEYDVYDRTLNLAAGETRELEVTLDHVLPTPGWMRAEPHLHAAGSVDSTDTRAEKARALVATHVELPILTEHDRVDSLQPTLEALGLGAFARGVGGLEITARTGHFNAFPLTPRPDRPGGGRLSWFGRPVSEVVEEAVAHREAPFVQANHPRLSGVPYFTIMRLDPNDATSPRDDYAADFHGFEVMNRCDVGAGFDRPTVADWFNFLNNGKRKSGVGSTDDHALADQRVGLPVTYVRTATETPAGVPDRAVAEAFKRGRLTVSCGPVVEMWTGAAEIGDTVRTEGGTLPLRLRVQAPPWAHTDRLRIVVNGEVALDRPLPDTGRVRLETTLDVPVPAGRDGWVLAWVSGSRAMGPWVRGQPSLAFTNPIYLDGDGDGAWTMR